MSEDMKPNTPAEEMGNTPAPQNDSAPVPAASTEPAPTPASAGAPVPPPAPGQQPVEPAGQQPAPNSVQPQQPAMQPNPAAQGQPQQPNPQQPNQQQPQQPQPTFRENGAFSFFATPSDPDEDSKPMSWGFKIGWFVLGFIGGMLGLVMAFISTTTLSPKRRRQALFATWIGFAVQAVLFLFMVLTGTSIPFLPFGTTATQTATTGTGSASAFG